MTDTDIMMKQFFAAVLVLLVLLSGLPSVGRRLPTLDSRTAMACIVTLP